MAVGPERRDKKEYCHPGKQESAGPEIVILIPEEKVHHHRGHIGEPEQIRDDEHLTERNVVVKGYVDDPVVARNGALEVTEPCQIYNTVDDQRKRMPVLLQKTDK